MKPKVLVGAIVVAIAAVAGFLLQRLITERPSISEATVASVPKPPAPAPADDTSTADGDAPRAHPVPETLPAVTMPDREGVSRQLSEWKGRPLIVNFWATWCGPCREEIPLLKELRNQRARDRLEIVGIAIDRREDVLKYAHAMGIDYPVLIGEKEGYAAAESFGVSLVLPFSVFADSRGRIVTLKIGELHPDEAAYILDRVRDIDMHRLELTDARRQIADKLRDFAIDRGKQSATSG
jgi:thiol-disulfide isomerase/thioredoxin